MPKSVFDELFTDPLIIKRVKNKLPHLFQLAELESSRNGKIGMEVGSVRERILIALLMYKFGIDIVDPNIRITSPELDVYVKKTPLSIKTLTVKKNKWKAMKLAWTVDAERAISFKETYQPWCDMMVAKICWNETGKLLLFKKESQKRVFRELGKEKYIKLPKPGTNSRGVEISKEALSLLEEDVETRSIDINFVRRAIDYREVYTKWLDAWVEEY